jgi:molybdenum cofactor guanylyltransferase
VSRPHGLILAGGRGERLGGVRKSSIRIGRVRLVDRVAKAFEGIEAPLLISTGHDDHGAVPEGAVAVADLDSRTGGPLAGLAAAVDWFAGHGVHSGTLVCAAVDTPFLPLDYAAEMERGLGNGHVAYARWGEAFYPTNAIWRLETIADLPMRVRAGSAPRSLKALIEQLEGLPVYWRAGHGEDPFANLNTLADLVALGRRAKME